MHNTSIYDIVEKKVLIKKDTKRFNNYKVKSLLKFESTTYFDLQFHMKKSFAGKSYLKSEVENMLIE